MEKKGELQGRRGARRGRALNFYGEGESFCENFEPIDHGNDGQIQSLSRDC